MKDSLAIVPTQLGSKYLQQLCKHWQHSLAVEFTPQVGTIVFPKNARGADHPGDGVVTLTAAEGSLLVHVQATSQEQLSGLQGAVSRHLDRFAFREAPLAFDWHSA
jgi:hypothetical protein